MKRIYIALFLSLISQSAFAAYGGFEIQHNDLSATTNTVNLVNTTYKPKVDDYYNTSSVRPAVFVGANVLPNLDIEAIYSYLSTSKTNDNTGLVLLTNHSKINTESKIKLHNLGIDVKPFIQLSAAKLYGILGINYLRASVEENYSANGFSLSDKESKDALGFSIGAGVEYEIIKNLAVRAQAKYTQASMNFSKLTGLKSIDNITTLSGGVALKF